MTEACCSISAENTGTARCPASGSKGKPVDWTTVVALAPELEEAAELFNLASNSTRLKILFLLDRLKELCVCDLRPDGAGVSLHRGLRCTQESPRLASQATVGARDRS